MRNARPLESCGKSPTPPEGVEAFPAGGPGTRQTFSKWADRSQPNLKAGRVQMGRETKDEDI